MMISNFQFYKIRSKLMDLMCRHQYNCAPNFHGAPRIWPNLQISTKSKLLQYKHFTIIQPLILHKLNNKSFLNLKTLFLFIY